MKANDNSYNCAPANPYFVGWNNIYTVYDAAMSAVQSAGLIASEFDITNEIDPAFHTVMGRMIVDNKHTGPGINPRPLEAVRYYLNTYGSDYLHASYSTGDVGTVLSYDCSSLYGDSARLTRTSALVSAIAGGLFGLGSISPVNGLPCATIPVTSSSTVGMPSTSYPFTPPTIIDFHTYIGGGASEVTLLFNNVWSFYNSFSPIGWRGYNHDVYTSIFIVGETHSNVNACGQTKTDASNVVTGYNASSMAGRSPTVIFRPWNNVQEGSACYPYPHTINPPYTPVP